MTSNRSSADVDVNSEQDDSLGRADRIARWIVLVLIAVTAFHGVFAALGLYADGSFLLVHILHFNDFVTFHRPRIFAEFVTQSPVVLAMHWGVTDIATLIRIHSVGVVVIPLALWVGALSAQWRRPMFWALVAMFAVTQLNSGWFVTGEYNLAYAAVALSAALLLRRQALTWWQLLVLAAAALLTVRAYEGMVYLAPILLAIAAARAVGVRGVAVAGSKAERFALFGLCIIYVVATVLAAWWIAHTPDRENLGDAMDVLGALRRDPQFVASAVLAILVVAIPLLSANLRKPVCGAVAVGAVVLLIPGLWAAPRLHYEARTITGLALGGLLVGAVVVRIVTRRDRTAAPEDSDAAPTASVDGIWAAGFALLCALLVPYSLHTAEFARWVADLERLVVTSSGPIPVAESGLDPRLTSRYSWGWANPSISMLLRQHAGQGTLLPPPGEGLTWPREPLPDIPPPLVKRSDLFPLGFVG